MRLPDKLSVPLLRAMKKPLNAARADEALGVLDMPVEYGDFSSLTGAHVSLTTYKRDGTPVPSPVWFAKEGDRVYVFTEINAFKAKRLGRDPRALLAPCNVRGVPSGNPVAATGRILTDAGERDHAADALRRAWGPGRRLFGALARPVTEVHYLEFVPAPRPSGA